MKIKRCVFRGGKSGNTGERWDITHGEGRTKMAEGLTWESLKEKRLLQKETANLGRKGDMEGPFDEQIWTREVWE